MLTTWNQRMYRAVQSYVRQNVLDEESIRVVKRALYFGQYRVAVHFGPLVTNWTDYNDLHASIVSTLRGRDYKLVHSPKAMYFNVYTNDSDVLRLLRGMEDMLDFSSISCIDQSCWELKQPRPKNKGPYYHKFNYRVRVQDSSKLTPEGYQGLMQGNWLIFGFFFYCVEVRDLLMFKLLHAQDIQEINERS